MLHWTIPLKNNKSNKEESRKESAKHTVLSLKVYLYIYKQLRIFVQQECSLLKESLILINSRKDKTTIT